VYRQHERGNRDLCLGIERADVPFGESYRLLQKIDPLIFAGRPIRRERILQASCSFARHGPIAYIFTHVADSVETPSRRSTITEASSVSPTGGLWQGRRRAPPASRRAHEPCAP